MKYLTAKDVSDILNLSLTSTYRLMKLKDFPSFRIGKLHYIREDDFDNYFKELRKSKIYLN